MDWTQTRDDPILAIMKKFLLSPRIKGLIKVTQPELDCVARSYGVAEGRENEYWESFRDVFSFTLKFQKEE